MLKNNFLHARIYLKRQNVKISKIKMAYFYITKKHLVSLARLTLFGRLKKGATNSSNTSHYKIPETKFYNDLLH